MMHRPLRLPLVCVTASDVSTRAQTHVVRTSPKLRFSTFRSDVAAVAGVEPNYNFVVSYTPLRFALGTLPLGGVALCAQTLAQLGGCIVRAPWKEECTAVLTDTLDAAPAILHARAKGVPLVKPTWLSDVAAHHEVATRTVPALRSACTVQDATALSVCALAVHTTDVASTLRDKVLLFEHTPLAEVCTSAALFLVGGRPGGLMRDVCARVCGARRFAVCGHAGAHMHTKHFHASRVV